MKDTAKYVNLDEVVYEYINQARLTSADFLRLWPIAVRGLKELNFDGAADPVTRKLTVLPNKTVELPADYRRWNKIGALNEKGEVATLKHNPDFTAYAATDVNRTSVNTDSSAAASAFPWMYQNYYLNDGCYNLYGVPPGTVNYGECKILEDEGVIILSNDYPFDYVILEYLNCPVASADFRIDALCVDALIAWMAWKDVQHHKRTSPTIVRERKNDYYREKRNMKPKISPTRLQDLNDIFLRGNRLSLRN